MPEPRETMFGQLLDVITKYSMNPEVCQKGDSSSRIIEDLRVNSARIIDVALEIEDVFDIEVSDKEMDQMTTVHDALTLIRSKKDAEE